jgi:hypothetical protein
MGGDEYMLLAVTMRGSAKASAARDMAMATWCAACIGRGDNARFVFLADLIKPQLLKVLGACAAGGPPARPAGLQGGRGEVGSMCNSGGPQWHGLATRLPPPPACALMPLGASRCFLLSAVLKGGKRQFGGRPAYAGSIRHRDPVQCNHGALGWLLVWTYTIGGAPFPYPGKGKVWRKTPLWPGNDPARSISYTQHAEALNGFLAKAGIITGKLTHAFRAFKAQDLDEQGVSDEVCVRARRGLRGAGGRLGGARAGCKGAGQGRGPQRLRAAGAWHTPTGLLTQPEPPPPPRRSLHGWGAGCAPR